MEFYRRARSFPPHPPPSSSRRALTDLITAIKPRQVFASGEEILIKSARSLLSRRKVSGGVIDRRIDYHKNYRSRLVKPRFIESLCTRIKRNPFNGESTLLRKPDTGFTTPAQMISKQLLRVPADRLII